MKKMSKGFTLIELMVTVVIIGVLSAIAFPAYTDYVVRAKRADATDSVLWIASRLEDLYLIDDTYANAVLGVAVGVKTSVGDATSKQGRYTLALSGPGGNGNPNRVGYTITASPVTTDSACGNLIYDSLGQRTDSQGKGDCW